MGRKKITVPPWCSFGVIEQFLEKNKQINFTTIDVSTLQLHEIGRGYENKVLSALRWLDLVDQNGKPTSKLVGLRVTGKEFQEKLAKVATDAYSDLINKVPPDKVGRTQIINYFMQLGYSINRANISLSFLVSLWKLAELELSEELKTPKITVTEKQKKEAKTQAKTTKPTKVQRLDTVSGEITMIVEGKQHDFNLSSDLDMALFKALADELMKKWPKSISKGETTKVEGESAEEA